MTKKNNGSRKPSRETLLEFPCRFPIKAMGRTSEGFQAIVTHIVRGHAELWPGESVRCNESRNGNYLAVTYECETRDARASNWFTFAERGKQVLGKRQDAERRVDGDHRHARVREVATLPPEGSLTLPLVDGWRFSRGSADDDNWVSYRLSRE